MCPHLTSTTHRKWRWMMILRKPMVSKRSGHLASQGEQIQLLLSRQRKYIPIHNTLQTAYRYTQLSHTPNWNILICSVFWPQENSQGNKGRTSPYFNKESQDDNDCAHDRTPPFDEHVNYQVKWESIGFSKCCCKLSVHFWKGVYGFHTGTTYTICCTGWSECRRPHHNDHYL